MSLPDAIRRHRKLNLMTQAEYAEHIGVAVGTVMGWEQGLRTPSLALARKLVAKGVDRSVVLAAVVGEAKGEAA